MPGKQVQQSTFDAIVREAMTDFGMSAAEAVADAREQLTKAGVTDLSNLVDPTADGKPDAEHAGIALPEAIRAALERSAPAEELASLLSALGAVPTDVAAVAGANGAVDAVVDALARGVEDVAVGEWCVAEPACAAVVALCGANEVNRTRFAAQRDQEGVALLKALLEAAVDADNGNGTALRSTAVLRALGAVQRRSEPVKQRVASGGSLDALLQVLEDARGRLVSGHDLDGNVALFSQACLVLRQSLTPDDAAVAVAETFNRACIVTGRGSRSESGLRPLRGERNLQQVLRRAAMDARGAPELSDSVETAVLADCVALARLCAVSDEICSDLTVLEFDALAVALLKEKPNVVSLVQSCLGLLRNLAARDQCKTTLFEKMDDVRKVAEVHVRTSHTIVESFCGFVASLCLRRPDIARRSTVSGVLNLILVGMEQHEPKMGVQRMGCLAVRNACSRDATARKVLRDDGKAEKMVRKAWKAFPRECDELAYNALRDLDVLGDDELRRDDRYTMPAGFFSIKPSRVAKTGIGFDDMGHV